MTLSGGPAKIDLRMYVYPRYIDYPSLICETVRMTERFITGSMIHDRAGYSEGVYLAGGLLLGALRMLPRRC